MTPQYHSNPQTHDQRLETILFQAENIIGFGRMAAEAPNPERRAEALEALKIKARAMLAALEEAHFERVDGGARLAVPFPVGSKVRIHTAKELGALGQVVALRTITALGNVDVQLSNGPVIPARFCDLELA